MKQQLIKVLVVEDEILLLKNISKKISQISPAFCIIGEAFNGKDALKLIKTCRPDIIFTDIRMPIMDGLELCKILKEEYPDILIVIVSGYNDFEYARTALSYNVCDYLLKPVQTNTLTELLSSLQKRLATQNKHNLTTLLFEQLQGESAASIGSTLLDTYFFTPFLINIGNLPLRNKLYDFSENLTDTLNTTFLEKKFKAAPFSFSDFYFYPYNFSSNLFVLLIEDLSSPAAEAAQYIHTLILQYFPKYTVCLTHGDSAVSISQLFTTVKQLYNILRSNFTISHSVIFSADKEPPVIPPAILSSRDSKVLQAIINTKNVTEFQHTLQNFFIEWNEKQYPQNWIEKTLLYILTLMQQNLGFSEDDYDDIYQNIFYTLETEATLTSASKKIIADLTSWLYSDVTMTTEIEKTITELYQFICTHYTETINVADLAAKYHFNHSYLTRIFKKQTGESPLRLINSLRIADAKKLLKNQNLSIREISEMLGFTTQHYFSRIFKDFTGKSPKEYRSL